MESYSADAIRNICLLAHGGVGKTTLLEAMTYTTKGSTRLGRTDQGSSMYDTRDEEKQRRMTIGIKTSFIEHQGKKINVLDTSGFIEMLAETKIALRAVESAVIMVDALDGIQVGTEQVAKYVDDAKLPKLFFINKVDRENADFSKVLGSLKDYFGTSIAAVHIPIGEGSAFKGIVDLLAMEAYTYTRDGNGNGAKTEIPANMKALVDEMRTKLMESIAETDEGLMNKFLETNELSQSDIASGLLKGVTSGTLFPVLCGSAVGNMGTDLLLKSIISFCPPASVLKEIVGISRGNEEIIPVGAGKPASAFVYKTISDEHLGAITFLKVLSGTIKTGDELLNTNKDSVERLGALFAMRGTNRTDMGVVNAGDICATMKLKNTHTGNMLCAKERPFQMPPTDFPSPLVEKAMYPKSKGDDEKISVGLTRLHEEDPIFNYGFNSEIKQTIISGMGDVHIDIIISSLKKRFNVSVDLKEPKIPYRETIKGKGDSKYRHKKQTGGAGQFAEVWMRIEPKARGGGVEFINSLVGQNVDRSFVPSVEKGVMSACEEGVLAGCHIVDVKVDFYDGKMHPVDSKDVAFQIAGKAAFKECFLAAKPILLEPIYEVEVVVPEEYTGDIMGDLSSRRGKIGGMDRVGKSQTIKAKLPFAELSTYTQTLRSITQGRGFYSRKFDHYEEVPSEQAAKILASLKKDKEEPVEG